MASITQVFGPQVSGGYKLAIVVDRSNDPAAAKAIAQTFSSALLAEPWILEVKDRLQVFAVTFDDPRDFHSRLPPDGNMSLYADYQRLLPEVRAEFPDVSAVGLASTTTANHGSGGLDVFAFSTAGTDWVYHMLHEWGHSFLLADEYYGGSGTYGGAEPIAPNLTIETRRELVKWRSLFSPATVAIPTWRNEPISQYKPPDGAVGLFEGGMRYYNRGVWHPSKVCRMGGDSHYPFCKVCERAIVARIKGAQVIEPVPVPPATKLVYLSSASLGLKMLQIPVEKFPWVIHAFGAYWHSDKPAEANAVYSPLSIYEAVS